MVFLGKPRGMAKGRNQKGGDCLTGLKRRNFVGKIAQVEGGLEMLGMRKRRKAINSEEKTRRMKIHSKKSIKRSVPGKAYKKTREKGSAMRTEGHRERVGKDAKKKRGSERRGAAD